MDKQSILDAVSQALDAMGMDSGMGGDELDENGMTSTGDLPVWNRLNVTVPATTRGPIADKTAVFGGSGQGQAGAQSGKGFQTPKYIGGDPYAGAATDAYGMPLAGDQEAMMSATGMV